MNFIVVGAAAFLLLVVIALVLFNRLGFTPLKSLAHAKRKAAEDMRKTQILKG